MDTFAPYVWQASATRRKLSTLWSENRHAFRGPPFASLQTTVDSSVIRPKPPLALAW